MKIAWNEPNFGKEELKQVKEVLESGYVSEGPKTKELEKKLAKIVGSKHVIMTTSATAALYLAIEADKRIRHYKDGEVIIPDLTFVATKNAVEMAGLRLRIEDVHPKTFSLNDCIFNEKTKIVIPVNILGRSRISKYDGYDQDPVTIICDNAGALGSKVSNGMVGCYSLQSNKIITCGQGGFCATDSDEYAKEIRKIKDFGRANKEDNNTKGFNFKFNDILAGIALGQLETLTSRRSLLLEQYSSYKSKLSDYGRFIEYLDGEIPLWIEFITDKRDTLFDYLISQGITCRKPWKAIIDNPKLYPNTCYYAKSALWLPNGSCISKKDITFTCDKIINYLELKNEV